MEQQAYTQAPEPGLSFRHLPKPDPSADELDRQPDRAAVKEHGLPARRRSFLQTTQPLPHPDPMRRPYEVWYSMLPVFSRWTVAHFFQSTHSIWMNLDAGGIQAHHIYLDLDDTQLLQMQDSFLPNRNRSLTYAGSILADGICALASS